MTVCIRPAVCFVGAAVAAALVSAPILAPAPARAACDKYQFNGGSVQIELDDGARLTIPAAGQKLGPGRAVIQHGGGGAVGNPSGGITGRNVDFTIANWDQGLWSDKQTWFTGSIDDNGRASGFYYVNTDGPGGWHTTDTLVCVAAPAPAPAPAPMPKLPPPAEPPTDVVSVSWGDFKPGVGLPVQVINTSATLGRCTYDATAPNSLLPPYHHDFVVSPVSVPAKWNIPGIPTGTQWHVVVSCRGDFNGQNVEIGHVDTTKTF
jgi:hypothetical protein